MSTAHAFLPASGAGAWVSCAQWPTMNAMFPSVDSEDSLEGRAAHWALSEVMEGRSVAEGQVTPDAYVLDAEMVRCAEATQEWLATLLPADAEKYVERTVDISAINPENYGTPDMFAMTAPKHLIVFDYKYGYGYVDVFENWQLMDYTRGILDFLEISSLDELQLTVVLAVAQPRNYDREGPFRTWEINASDLRAYWNILYAAAARATSDDREATPGAHCLHCPGRVACPTLRESDFRVMKVLGDGTPFALPTAQAAHELGQLEEARAMLEARISGLASEVEAAYLRGDRGHGYVVEQTPGRQYWAADPDKIATLGGLYGVDLTKPLEVKTPVQAIAAGVPAAVVNQYARRNMSDLKLVKTEKSFAYKAFFKR